VYCLVSRVLGGRVSRDADEPSIQHRLMMHSLAEDGEFARLRLRRLASSWIPQVEDCIKVAIAEGEAVAGAVQPRLAGWLVHDLAVAVRSNLLPKRPVVDYGVSHEKLVEHTVWFGLRGMGLKEEVIEQYYNPKALALFTSKSV
jgi:hypothetical protein